MSLYALPLNSTLTIHTVHVLAIEDDYKGPQLEDGKVTLKFMKDLMEHYKAQKRLHRKFAYKVSSKQLFKA